MFKPLKDLFWKKNYLKIPVTTNSDGLGAYKASVILIQDYRSCKESLAWKDLLLFLKVKL